MTDSSSKKKKAKKKTVKKANKQELLKKFFTHMLKVTEKFAPQESSDANADRK